MDKKNSINGYKKKKKRNKTLIILVVILAAAIILAVVIVNRDFFFSPLKNVGLNVGEGGYPVVLPGSTEYHMGELSESFYLLTDTYLYTYTDEGAEISGIQHGFQNPVSVSNNRRVFVYDKNGTSFKMYSRTGELFTNSVSDSIVFAQIGNTERTAVVTTSTRYSNYLYVYNSDGNQIFRWASPEEKIMGVCFDSTDSNVFVSVVGEKGGELRVSLMKFNLKNSESEVWRTDIGDNITYSLECADNGFYCVTLGGAFLLDYNSGEIKASNSFVYNVHGIPDADGMIALIFDDPASNGETLVSYNSELLPQSSVSLENLTAFDVYKGRLYILAKDVLTVYNSSLDVVKNYQLDDEYSDLLIIDGCAFLLGYNTVQRVEL